MNTWRLLLGDAREQLAKFEAGSVQTSVTSPPYWGGVRDYGHADQLGLERDPHDYVATMVAVFAEVRRVLRSDGSLWVNVGDVYAASGKGGGGSAGDRAAWSTIRERKGFRMPPQGYKMKDLTLVPFQLADALRRDGWYLRSTIIWHKPAAVEPMRLDRPAVSHEYLFQFSASEHYAVRNPGELWWGHSVWKIQSESVEGFPAAMPSELVRRCVVASSQPGDTVLDPFSGSGTTGVVALRLGRSFVGVELTPEHHALACDRIGSAAPLFAEQLIS